MDLFEKVTGRKGLKSGRKSLSRKAAQFLFFLLTIYSSLWMAPETVRGDYSGDHPLYIVHDMEGRGIGSLKDLPVELYMRYPPYYLISLPDLYRGALKEKGFQSHALGRIEPGRSLYLLTRPDGRPIGSPSAGTVLFRGEDWLLVKVSSELLSTLGQEGYELSNIPFPSLPLEVGRGGVKLSTGSVYLSPEFREKMASSDSTIAHYLQRLEAFQTRYSYTDSVVAASEWIFDKFVEFGFTDVAYDSFWFSGTWQRNVVATKPGTVNPDKVIVIGGHYDSVTYDPGCDPMEWAPGVDDNGSQTALTLDMARILVDEDLEGTLKFVPFAAEEQGLHGSWHFAEEAFNSGMDIQLMINMDMIGNLADAYLDVEINTDGQSMRYAELMQAVALDSTDLIPRIGSAGPVSDHWPFSQYGFNHVYVAEGDFSPHWHQCTDTFENVDVPYMVQVENMVLPTILLVANAPGAPAGLTAKDHGDGQRITLEWDPNPEPDIFGYRVYSGSAPGEYDDIDTTFVDSFLMEGLVTGESLYVAVSALDVDGFESVLTDPMGVVPLVQPRPPQGVEATSYADRIVLSWEANSELDIERYSIMQGTRGGWDFYEIASLPATETTFVDSSVGPGPYYIYYVHAFDSTGHGSERSEAVFGRLATHNRGILVIDATRDGQGGSFQPTDDEVDQFYERLLKDFNLRDQWDYADSIEGGRRPLDADLGIYSTVVWHRDDRFGEDIGPDTVNIAKFLDTGGNLLVSGWSFLTNLAGDNTAFMPGSFFYDYLKISSFNTTQPAYMDFVGASATAGSYSDISIDEEKVITGGLFELNVLDAQPVDGVEIYTYVASDSGGSPYHGMGVGLEYLGEDFRVMVLNFPLFYMDSLEAVDLMVAAMNAFGEGPLLVEDGGVGGETGLPRVFALEQNYPNPFNPSTTITFSIPAGRREVPTRISIYDVRGRLVRRLVDESKDPGYYQVHWDGRDEKGSRISSGVYLYTLSAGDFRFTRKMLVVR